MFLSLYEKRIFMEYLMLALATFSNTAKTLAWKKIGNENQRGARLHLINAFIFFTAALTVLVVGLCSNTLPRASGITVLLGILYALFSTLTQILLIKAMGMGEASVTQLVYSLGILLPIIYGALFLEEVISPLQVVGVVLVLCALVLIINPKKNKNFRPLWLVLVLLAAIGSGSIAIVQKIHQSSFAKAELQTFVIISQLTSTLFSLLLYFIFRTKEEKKDSQMNGKFFGFLALCGLCVGVLNLSTSACAGLLPAVVQFPVYNIGSMVLVGILSTFLFRERLTRTRLLGFLLGCVAILFIGLF